MKYSASTRKPLKYMDGAYDGIYFLDAAFPKEYSPFKAFYMTSEIDTCTLPWTNTLDPFSSFMISGGSKGGLSGAISGLVNANIALQINDVAKKFGIGRGGDAPSLGYCIGNKFKQHVYTTMFIQNGYSQVVVTYVGIELLQNYRFDRIYISHGEVIKYNKLIMKDGTVEHSLTLDIQNNISPIINKYNDVIKITLSGNSTSSPKIIDVNILGIKNNWDIIISDPKEDIKRGSYYKLNNIMCVKDPYLLSGFWIGNENLTSTGESSGRGLYVTSHNSPYKKGKFLGVYIWKPNSGDTLQQPASGSLMDDEIDGDLEYSWSFYGFGNSSQYKNYPNDIRYKYIDGEGFKKRDSATGQDYISLASSGISYLRVEIGNGAGLNSHNWYAPCLEKEYINVGGKIFKILNHIEANVIDVSYLSIDGVSLFDPLKNQEYFIINQYAWMINEHYEQRIEGAGADNVNVGKYGIFKGTITSVDIKSSKVSITMVGPDTFVSSVDKGGISFIDRYIKDIPLYSSLKKMYKKFDGWKLVLESGREYYVDYVDFSKHKDNKAYEIIVRLKNETSENSGISEEEMQSEIIVGYKSYISFGDTFNVVGNFSKEDGNSFRAKFTATMRGTSACEVVTSNTMCIDGIYESIPYKISSSNNDRFGFCEGVYFGYDVDGTARDFIGQSSFIATLPSAPINLSSLYHPLSGKDWVSFEDPITKKITIRKGSLNFSDNPKKEIISFGGENYISYSSNPVDLDTSQDMVRSVSIKLKKENSKDLGFLFGIGNVKNVYGFYVSGLGDVNLELFNMMGEYSGSLPSDLYSGFGYSVSPVYLYNGVRSGSNAIDVGISAGNSQIYLINNASSIISDVDTISVGYIKSNQTISGIGYYDIFPLSNGEVIFIYGKKQEEFNIEGILNNSDSNDSAWYNPSSIMSLSTNDNRWRSPFINNGSGNIPMMLLGGVDYLCGLYNKFSNEIFMFVRCYSNEKSYIGVYSIPLNMINYKSFRCSGSGEEFLYRPPAITDAFVSDTSRSWTDGDIVDYGGVSDINYDNFIRIIGDSYTKSQIDDGGDFEAITGFIFPNGIYAIFYSDGYGVKMLYSENNGRFWKKSNIIFYKNARNAVLIDTCLIAINDYGIVSQKNVLSDFYDAITIGNMNEGKDKTNKEIELQDIIDKRLKVNVIIGRIEGQRLSGYISPDGIIKVFFYNEKMLLSCAQSFNSGFSWKIANNF